MEVDGSKPVAAMEPGTPLLRAVFLRRLRLTRLLLDGGAYVNESDSLGQTPLMVACTTQHEDSQSASRVKLVHFLLEKGADPNIQDKEGCSALMHACRERTEAGVVSLLLASGADVGLEDRSGTSALVYAVMAGDWAVLRLLLDSCKAKGKEVIIITTDQGPGGKLQAKQCMRVPPGGPPKQTTPAAATAPASPSEIQLITSPQPTSSLHPPKSVFCFKESQSCGFSSHPCSPSRLQRLCQAEEQGQQQQQQQHLLRLNSEPWLKIPQSLLKHHVASSFSERTRDLSPAEDVLLQIPKQDQDKTVRDAGLEGDPGGKKIILPGLQSPHSTSHPNLCCVTLGVDPCKSAAAPLQSMASSSFHSIIQRRKLGSDIYSSDPQLARDAHIAPRDSQQRQREGAAGLVGGEARRLAPLRCSSTLGSAESPPNSSSNRRILSGFERRGSGAFLLEQSSQSRPRSLPPLTLSSSNTSILNVYNSGSIGDRDVGTKTFLPSAPPGNPKELGRRMLLRRHSIQPQQFKSTA